MSLRIETLAMLKDNYSYFLEDTGSGQTAIIDPSEAEPILEFLKARKLKLNFILNTHHHHDHSGGNLELTAHTGAPVIAPKKDQHRIPGFKLGLNEGEFFELGYTRLRVLEIPGHTLGHIAFFAEQDEKVFTGDTLFIYGCGRLFEGTPTQMWNSLLRLRSLPDSTQIYCGHEYTLANLKFALSLEPLNAELLAEQKRIEEIRGECRPSIPTTISQQKLFNPFFKCDQRDFCSRIGMSNDSPIQVFTEIRKRKDQFS